MWNRETRRDWLKLAGLGGLVYASNLVGCARRGPFAKAPLREDFSFLQLSDTHWGYGGPANPEADLTLRRTVATINAARVRPELVVFTGDLTHKTDDPAERRRRMAEFKSIVGELRVDRTVFLPGEHDASADRGEAYREHFGELYYAFDHKGVIFIALDNVSDPVGAVGAEQLAWLERFLKTIAVDRPLVVFCHRPLFDLYPQWDWDTKDGARVIELLSTHDDVTVFYGHIHQENHHTTGKITHHSARSLMFALPAPGTTEQKAPVGWDPKHPGIGLGYRNVGRGHSESDYRIDEVSVERKA